MDGMVRVTHAENGLPQRSIHTKEDTKGPPTVCTLYSTDN